METVGQDKAIAGQDQRCECVHTGIDVKHRKRDENSVGLSLQRQAPAQPDIGKTNGEMIVVVDDAALWPPRGPGGVDQTGLGASPGATGV